MVFVFTEPVYLSLVRQDELGCLLLEFKETLGSDLAVTSRLMFAVIVPKYIQAVTQSGKTASKAATELVSDYLDIVEVREDRDKILEELLGAEGEFGSCDHVIEVGEVVIRMESVPMDFSIHYKTTSNEVLCKGLVVDAVGLVLLKIDPRIH